jgi:hypothetical protein
MPRKCGRHSPYHDLCNGAIAALVGGKAPEDHPSLAALRASAAKAQQQRDALVGGFQQKLEQLDAEQKKAVDDLVKVQAQ